MWSRFTHWFEALATNVKRAAEILRITWDQAWHMMERAVLRGRAAQGAEIPRLLGVDEKAIITNAVAEGLNSKIATVQKRACGYRNLPLSRS